MKRIKLTDTQKIFLLAKINGTDNRQDLLPVNGIDFPKNTWFQVRREQIKKDRHEMDDAIE